MTECMQEFFVEGTDRGSECLLPYTKNSFEQFIPSADFVKVLIIRCQQFSIIFMLGDQAGKIIPWMLLPCLYLTTIRSRCVLSSWSVQLLFGKWRQKTCHNWTCHIDFTAVYHAKGTKTTPDNSSADHNETLGLQSANMHPGS